MHRSVLDLTPVINGAPRAVWIPWHGCCFALVRKPVRGSRPARPTHGRPRARWRPIPGSLILLLSGLPGIGTTQGRPMSSFQPAAGGNERYERH